MSRCFCLIYLYTLAMLSEIVLRTSLDSVTESDTGGITIVSCSNSLIFLSNPLMSLLASSIFWLFLSLSISSLSFSCSRASICSFVQSYLHLASFSRRSAWILIRFTSYCLQASASLLVSSQFTVHASMAVLRILNCFVFMSIRS